MLPVMIFENVADPLSIARRSGGDAGVRPGMQFFDPEALCGRAHMEIAVARATRRHFWGEERARALGMEVLLEAGLTDQITVALKRVGVRSASRCVGVVALPPLPSGGPADDALPGWMNWLARQVIDDAELADSLKALGLEYDEGVPMPLWKEQDGVREALGRLGVVRGEEEILHRLTREMVNASLGHSRNRDETLKQ